MSRTIEGPILFRAVENCKAQRMLRPSASQRAISCSPSRRHLLWVHRCYRVLRTAVVGVLVLGVVMPTSIEAWAAERSATDDARGVRSAANVTSASARWYPPLGPPLQLAEPYRPPPTPYAAGHRGIDLPASTGAQVAAPVHGTVSFAGKVVDREVVSIRVDARTVVSMEPVSAEHVSAGETVSRGETLGAVAAGGSLRR